MSLRDKYNVGIMYLNEESSTLSFSGTPFLEPGRSERPGLNQGLYGRNCFNLCELRG